VLHPATSSTSTAGFDAFVVGSAAYMNRWLKDATDFVRSHAIELADHPTWLFSSGPIGPDQVDRTGRPVLEASIPHEFAELGPLVGARDRKVFFGAYDPDQAPVGLAERLAGPFMRASAVRAATEGDFRDWPAIEAWATGIADELEGHEPDRTVRAAG
jgi:menaquinone-dependent protoporphyrinogen oxidase